MFCHSECKHKGLDFKGDDKRELQNIPSADMCQSVCTSDPQCQYCTGRGQSGVTGFTG